MAEHSKVNFELNKEGLSLSEFTWPQLREFVDKLSSALAGMPTAPVAARFLPTSLRDGSIKAEFQCPDGGQEAVLVLTKGPNPNWSPEMYAAVAPLYEFMRRQGYVLKAGVNVLEPVVIPADEGDWVVRELTSLEGVVRRTGGQKGMVEMGFSEDGHVHCAAGQEIAKRLGAHLYETVLVSGEATREPLTGKLLSFSIDEFEVVEQSATHPSPSLRRAFRGVDVASFLKEMRG